MKEFVIIPTAGKRLIGKAKQINSPNARFAADGCFVKRKNRQ